MSAEAGKNVEVTPPKGAKPAPDADPSKSSPAPKPAKAASDAAKAPAPAKAPEAKKAPAPAAEKPKEKPAATEKPKEKPAAAEKSKEKPAAADKSKEKEKEKPAQKTPSKKPAPVPAAEEVSTAVPKFGRRANVGEGDAPAVTSTENAGDGEGAVGRLSAAAGTQQRPKDQVVSNVMTLADDDNVVRDGAENKKRAAEERQQLREKVSAVPIGYQAIMPRLTDMDINTNWDKLLTTIHSEFDMSCLTTCLSRELDEDVAWNPDMLLVQLTSDMHDAAEANNDAAFMPVDDSEIGLMQGGEVVRRRKEKGGDGDAPEVPKTDAGKKGVPLFSKKVQPAISSSKEEGGTAAVSRAGGGVSAKEKSAASSSGKEKPSSKPAASKTSSSKAPAKEDSKKSAGGDSKAKERSKSSSSKAKDSGKEKDAKKK